ncbi:MAG TPA: peptide ABC transporter ATP-binding protein [Firmicutes bacterium]|jgi:ABC-type glutathione transport system ATPase component|nr:ABC transporter ATP-binding protein [Bacillota bacterium]HAA34237.1 peptide ABC transporter ATP-binding protein [Bacillota bacterium]
MREAKSLLSVRNVEKSYEILGGGKIHVLRKVSLEVKQGAMVGLLGESGAGKTTLARIITGQETPDGGELFLEGKPLLPLQRRSFTLAADIQYIFQDPYSALEPSYTVEQTLREPLRLCQRRRRQGMFSPQEALELVGLPYASWAFNKKIGELSGGQRQRAAIARALIPRPRLLIADESVSMLDAKSAHSILDLLQAINAEASLGILFITHQISVLKKICTYVYVLYQGRIVEEGVTEHVLNSPADAYTRQLVENMKFFGEVQSFV